MTQPAVEVIGASKRFGDATVLHPTDLVIQSGEFVSILGPSGCGKTTLLRIISGFEQPTTGSVSIQGVEVTDVPPHKRPTNIVFQRGALFPHMNVFDNVAYSLKLRRVPKTEIKQRVEQVLALVKLDALGSRGATELSGGQIQRVALARALANRPSVLLLDEPLSALDLKLRQHMQLELREIQRELGATFVYVTHDQTEALVMSDRIAVMNEGQIVQIGTPREIYARPVSIFASDFIGETNLIPARVLNISGTMVEVDVAGAGSASGRAGAPVSVGEAVTLSIRPEALRVRDSVAASDSTSSSLPGTVRAAIFLGSHIRLEIDFGHGTHLQADLRNDDSRDLRPGDSIYVEWTKDAAVVWPEDEGSQA